MANGHALFLDELRGWLTPAAPLEVVAAIAALIAALFAVISEGNAADRLEHAWYRRPRIRAFLFLLSGGGAVLLLDIKGLAGDPGVDKVKLAGVFELWAALAIVALLAGGALVVFAETALASIRHPIFRRHLIDLPVTFVVQGWDASRRERDGIFADIEARRQDDLRTAEAARTETLGMLAQNALRVLRDVGGADASQRAHMIDEIFTSVASLVRRRAGEPQPRIRLNYLALRGFAEMPESRRADLLFTFGDTARYAHVLALRRRHNGTGEDPLGQPILIPVDSAASGPDRLLPGAPQLVHGLEHVMIQPNRLSFAPGIPQEVRTRVNAFFRALKCKSVLSLRLVAGSAVVGVLNIESSQPNMAGMDDNAVEDVLTIVQPFAAILAYVVEQDEHVRAV